MTRVIYSFRHVISLKLKVKCCFAFKRRTSVTQTLVVMAGSAQKQMEHTFVPVWKDTRASTVKVFFYFPALIIISTTASRTLIVTMVTVLICRVESP